MPLLDGECFRCRLLRGDPGHLSRNGIRTKQAALTMRAVKRKKTASARIACGDPRKRERSSPLTDGKKSAGWQAAARSSEYPPGG